MFYIRADANSIIGSGHIMRCLSIAKALKKKGQNTTFITADRNAQELIDRHGFSIICLQSSWNDLSNELGSLKSLIIKEKMNSILIDSYYADSAYLGEIKKLTKVIYMDDLNQGIYPVDALINYNIYADRLNLINRYPKETKLMIGCSYVPLREEFISIKHHGNESIQNILITTGGSDTYNSAGQIIEAIRSNYRLDFLGLHIVIGPLNQNKDNLEELAKQFRNIYLHYNVSNMSALMQDNDIAVSAGGSTLYELCACGIPAISFSYADNQRMGTQEFHNQGCIYYAGDIRDNAIQCMDNMIARIQELCEDYHLRNELSFKLQGLVDGNGAERIANVLLTI
jgi:UDP-2,4-diacetamido-2,4,6-trideoxy-beta-L-altropyranose hydrolase